MAGLEANSASRVKEKDEGQIETNHSKNSPKKKEEIRETIVSQTIETNATGKTPVSSAGTFKEVEEVPNPVEERFMKFTTSYENPSFDFFNETECLKFAEKLHKIVEELRINRVSERENELRIQKLMSEKSDLERMKDDEVLKNNELTQKYKVQQDEARKQFDEKLHCFQEDQTKHMLEKQSGEKEIKALKDEIRALHINKYTMEKLLKDQERQIQSHGTTTTNYLEQLAKLEKQYKDVFKESKQIITAVDKVEANVNASKKLHKKLMFMTNHQNCVLATYKAKLARRKQDLIALEARQASTSVENNCKESPSLVHLEHELRMQKELCQQVQVQLNDARQENQELIRSLNNAHELLEKHIETNNKFVETDALMQLELDELRKHCTNLKEELKQERICVQEKEAELKEVKNTQAKKDEEQHSTIERLKSDNESLCKKEASLEELNSKLSQKAVEQDDEIEKLKKRSNEIDILLKETQKESKSQKDDITKLEDNLKKKVSHYEDLLQKAQQEISAKANETKKWRERTTELLESEQQINKELQKLMLKKEIREQRSQEIQTEPTETAEKETNTFWKDTSLKLTSEANLAKKEDIQLNKTKEPDETVPKKVTYETAKDSSSKSPKGIGGEGHNHEAEHTRLSREVKKPHRNINSTEKNTEKQSELTSKSASCPTSVNDVQVPMETKPHGKSSREITSASVKGESSVTSLLLHTTYEQKQISVPDLSDNSASLKMLDKKFTSATKGTCREISKSGKSRLLNPKREDKRTLSHEKTNDKQPPLLAVVKPAISSRASPTKIAKSVSAGVEEGRLKQDSRDGSMQTSPVNKIACKVVPTTPIQPQSQNTQSLRGTTALGIDREMQPLFSVETTDTLINESAVVRPGEDGIEKTDDMKRNKLSDKGQKDDSPIPVDRNQLQEQPSLANEGKMDSTATKDPETARITEMEDFRFSDDEEEAKESITKTIGSQIDRIEAFLKNDRLRLSKKRKSPDE